jgi:hypothetical protein
VHASVVSFDRHACAISDADRDAALAASELLDMYNNGEVGPGHCE